MEKNYVLQKIIGPDFIFDEDVVISSYDKPSKVLVLYIPELDLEVTLSGVQLQAPPPPSTA